MAKFKQGDVVRLKSGGPLMTVETPDNSDELYMDQAFCTWFHNDNKKSDWFNADALEHDDGGPASGVLIRG